MGSPTQLDLGGVDLVVKSLMLASTPGASPTTVIASDGQVNPQVNVISGLGATRTLTAAESGSTILLDRAAGIALTLPAAQVGLNYKLVVTTSVTSNAYKVSTATQGTEFFSGTVNSLGDAAAASVVFTADGSTHDNLSMNGSTTGGLVGTVLTITCVSSTLWLVEGLLRGSGSEATPFATT